MVEGEVSRRQIKKIEIAYKKLFLKSRELGSQLPKHEQDEILERVVEEKFFEVFDKLHQQGEINSEDKSLDFYEQLKVLMQKWKTEMEAEEETKKWWKFWR